MAKHKYTMEDWRAVRRGLDAGGTIRGVAEATGVDRNAVFRWGREDEPPERMWLSMKVERILGLGRHHGVHLAVHDAVGLQFLELA